MAKKQSAVKRVPKGRGGDGQLARILHEAIQRSGLSVAAVARASEIDRTYLYHVLSGRKSLSEEKVIAVARTLRIPPESLLDAAGCPGTPASKYKIDLFRATEVQPLPDRLSVITDPRFFDSALFFWLLSTQPLKPGVICDLRSERWADVHVAVGTEKGYAVGFYNRRTAFTLSGKPIYNVHSWADLCFYKGYALIARPGEAEAPATLEDVRAVLKSFLAKGRNTIISMGADTVWRLHTNLTPELNPVNFKVQEVPNPDFAFDRFREGIGDLFVGGLPQRLKAKDKGCIEILNFELNPLLFSFNSLICSTRVHREHQSILNAITSVWFRAIAQIREDGEFREYVKESILALLAQIGIRDHSLTPDGFDQVFDPHKAVHEVFPSQPSDLIDCYADAIQRVLKLMQAGVIRQEDVGGVAEAAQAARAVEIEAEHSTSVVPVPGGSGS